MILSQKDKIRTNAEKRDGRVLLTREYLSEITEKWEVIEAFNLSVEDANTLHCLTT